MPEMVSHSLRRRPKRSSENALNKNLRSLLDDISYDTAARKLVNTKPQEENEDEMELEQMDSIISDMEDELVVETDNNKLVEESIFDFVVEMEKQFGDILDDVEEIKKAKGVKDEEKD